MLDKDLDFQVILQSADAAIVRVGLAVAAAHRGVDVRTGACLLSLSQRRTVHLAQAALVAGVRAFALNSKVCINGETFRRRR